MWLNIKYTLFTRAGNKSRKGRAFTNACVVWALWPDCITDHKLAEVNIGKSCLLRFGSFHFHLLSTMEPRSQDNFTSVYGPQFPSTNFGLQPLPTTFRAHEWAKNSEKTNRQGAEQCTIQFHSLKFSVHLKKESKKYVGVALFERKQFWCRIFNTKLYKMILICSLWTNNFSIIWSR